MGILKDFLIIFCTIFSTMTFARYHSRVLFPCAILLSILLTMKCFSYETKVKNNKEITQKQIKIQRDKFVNSLTHDLRIPVIAQLRALELFNNGTLGKLTPTQQEIAAQTVHSCRYILDLISLLINAYKIESSEHRLIYESFNILDLISKCFDELMDEAAEKNITFECKCEYDELFLTADKEEIKNVIHNLIFTSIIHSTYSTKIAVEVYILLYEQQNEEYGSIGDDDSSYTTIGQNIRMNYCKKIIETHNGRVLESENNPGLFIFEIPQTIKA